MSKIEDGGPAFPVPQVTGTGSRGMSLRDWFAGQALEGLFAAEANPRTGVEVEPFNSKHCPWFAQLAYELADAMLKERSK